jgi:hypothetical protein
MLKMPGVSLPSGLLLLAADTSSGHSAHDLLNNIGLCVVVAATLAYLANKLKHPK